MRNYYIHTKACSYSEQYQPKHTYTFTGPCIITGKTYSITVDGEKLYKFNQSGNILDLSDDPNVREFAMSGTSPEGWDLLFKEE